MARVKPRKAAQQPAHVTRHPSLPLRLVAAFVSILPLLFPSAATDVLHPLFSSAPVHAAQPTAIVYGTLAALFLAQRCLRGQGNRRLGWRACWFGVGAWKVLSEALVRLGGERLQGLGLSRGILAGRFLVEGVPTLLLWSWLWDSFDCKETIVFLPHGFLPFAYIASLLLPRLASTSFTRPECYTLQLHGIVLCLVAIFASRTYSPPQLRRHHAASTFFSQASTFSRTLVLAPVLALAHAVALTTSHCPTSTSQLPPGVLASRRSVTGWITVGEHVVPSPDGSNERDLTLRYLRADHSLLGGLWVGPSRDMLKMQFGGEPTEEEVVKRAESIYSTFILQEAVRLVKAPQDVPRQTPEQGLIIGLGAGLSARALARHGVNLTLVEIDPAVHEFAERYFGVNEVKWGEVVLKDAVEWVDAQAKETSPSAFDYIVHDVFTGGAVPATLFTSTFLTQLKSLLHHSGSLALNFAGTLSSNSSRSILSTLLSVFPHCRAFEDVPHTASGPAESTSDDTFRNMVILCSKEWYAPVGLRNPVKGDFLDYPSPMIRRSVFASFRQHEIDLARFKPAPDDHGVGTWLLRDKNDVRRVEAAQLDEVGMHWDAMEKVLPPEVWARW
ncbi:spermine synthase [Rhodotorula toruloides]|uniref:BY PROTMAP: gi/472586781/gb/EMS24300.1/ spermine synthase [Rhodosporidium toruloides NP11] gi/647398194/emb/CDR41856.1/ RHTO0S06e07140g1_1 [Rhodosporidium toruloides] n=1 Tax=Rhodotorula toruloides TaxID=5286 RepID=A0A0K3CB82_RHOTO|nr:spermine synthase [Rhodotorula toruloides]PRQ76259.1 hypothetical protein AAT19DRAFT_13281 [Rhodotorula toruloides]